MTFDSESSNPETQSSSPHSPVGTWSESTAISPQTYLLGSIYSVIMFSTLPAVLPVLLQLGGVLDSPLGELLTAIVAIALVILVGRVALRIAWRLVTIAAVVVAVAFLVTRFTHLLL